MRVLEDTVTPWTERSNRVAGFSPINGGQLIPVGTSPFPGNHITNGRYTNYGPRFGLAYSINSRTVLRGGVGIFYAFENNTSNVNLATNAPFHGSLVATNSSTNYAAAAPISAGFPAGRPTLYPTANTNFVYYPRSYKNPSANEFNLNLQTQFSSRDVLSIAYVGQTGVHFLVVNNINLATPGPGTVATRRPYPNRADGTQNNPEGNSSYHSFQASYIYTATKSLHLQAAYTYSHSLDDTSGTGSVAGFQNPYVLSSYYGNSDFDLRHSLVLSQTYDLPFGRGQSHLNSTGELTDLLVGGWQIRASIPSRRDHRLPPPWPPQISTTVRVCSTPTGSAPATWQIARRSDGSTLRISYNRPRTPSGTPAVISCLVPEPSNSMSLSSRASTSTRPARVICSSARRHSMSSTFLSSIIPTHRLVVLPQARSPQLVSPFYSKGPRVKFNLQPNSTSSALDYTRIGMGLVRDMSSYLESSTAPLSKEF